MAAIKPRTEFFAGPVGRIETDVHEPAAPAGIALVAHPHPLMGGTKDNKVATTLARTLAELGNVVLRPNFRGVGKSAGVHDEGRGETDDLVAVIRHAQQHYGNLPLICAGFSFGGFVQTRVAAVLSPTQLILVAPAITRFDASPVPENTLLIHGDTDDVVPLQAVLEWARPHHLPVVVVPGGEHFFHGKLHVLRNIVMRYCRAGSAT